MVMVVLVAMMVMAIDKEAEQIIFCFAYNNDDDDEGNNHHTRIMIVIHDFFYSAIIE